MCQRRSWQAGDQDAVDAVTRKRDTITRTAADTEVLLHFAKDPDQASTAAPLDDEQDLFGREEALRMDEEIMNFQWFDHITWDSINFEAQRSSKLNMPSFVPSSTTTLPH